MAPIHERSPTPVNTSIRPAFHYVFHFANIGRYYRGVKNGSATTSKFDPPLYTRRYRQL